MTISEWYKSDTLKVHHISGKYLYFTSDSSDGLNSDFTYAMKFPRFKLTNTNSSPVQISNGKVHLSNKLTAIHLCKNGRLLTANGAELEAISFTGFSFAGNRDNVYALMDFTNVKAQSIVISGCEFCGLRSKIIQVAYSANFTFSDNYVHDCYRAGVTSFAAANTIVKNNVFNNVGLALSNDFCVCCSGENYLICDNKFSDFGYGAIAIGMHYLTKRSCKLTGTVRNNEIWYSDSYRDKYRDYTLMDSGAIYVYTQNDRAIISENYIHDYIGIKDNRGIFMDDGASNVTVENNTVLRIGNSWCIDSRLMKSVETVAGSQVKKVNYGIVIRNNKVDGKIRFEK